MLEVSGEDLEMGFLAEEVERLGVGAEWVEVRGEDQIL
ncbi:MAG: hypothetical protein ACI9NQ_000483 [Paracoccaceae bacterium]|jgi:hypothetical protein